MRIILRADVGFARKALMAWCEVNRGEDVFGVAFNDQLETEITPAMQEGHLPSTASDQAWPVFRDFMT